MNDIDEPPRPNGLSIGNEAPLFDTTDLYGNPMNLEDLLSKNGGVMIDFFRGNW